jgi:hypothetical protein
MKLRKCLIVQGTLSTAALNFTKLERSMRVDNLESAFVPLRGGGYGLKTLCNGMKKALDNYISSNYSEVRAYTTYFLKKMGSYIDADTVINNSYLHVINIEGDPDKVKSYLLNTIKYQVLWSCSKSNKDDRITAIEHLLTEPIENDDLYYKLREDRIYSFNKALIEIYRNEITDRVQKIVYEAYIDRGYVTAKSMAQYFGITTTSAYYFIKDIKQNLNELQYRYESEPIY